MAKVRGEWGSKRKREERVATTCYAMNYISVTITTSITTCTCVHVCQNSILIKTNTQS